MNLHYSFTQNGHIQIIEPGNLLSEYANKEILQAMQAKIDEGFSTFVVDLHSVEYMNSVGLNLLLTLRARSDEHGGQLALANPSSKVLQLLKVTKLLPLFQIEESVEEALDFLAETKQID
jgi:anti-anti-sigma factor